MSLQAKMQRTVYKESEEVDIISQLPSCVLLHIMEFLTTKEVVRTSVLSKTWRNIWKFIPVLIIKRIDFQKAKTLEQFISKVFQQRDNSTSLHSISIDFGGHVHPKILTKVISYALSHNVEKFRVASFIHGNCKKNMGFFHSILFCHSLKYLNLSLHKTGTYIEFPDTIDLPELVTCYLKFVTFTSSNDKDLVQPFSKCQKLTDLVISNCELQNGKDKVLCVSAEKLTNMIMEFGKLFCDPFKVQMYAPMLKSFSYVGEITSSNNQLFENNLEFLEEAIIEVWCHHSKPENIDTLKIWLQRISNVHSLKLCSETLKVFSRIPNFSEMEPICFSKLRSLIVKCSLNDWLPYGVLEYLIQDSPLEVPTFILGVPSYVERRLTSIGMRVR